MRHLFLHPLTLEDGRNRLYRNVGNYKQRCAKSQKGDDLFPNKSYGITIIPPASLCTVNPVYNLLGFLFNNFYRLTSEYSHILPKESRFFKFHLTFVGGNKFLTEQ
jgi:hypothetical protein